MLDYLDGPNLILAVVRTSMKRTQPASAAFQMEEESNRSRNVGSLQRQRKAGKQLPSRKEGSHADTLGLAQRDSYWTSNPKYYNTMIKGALF